MKKNLKTMQSQIASELKIPAMGAGCSSANMRSKNRTGTISGSQARFDNDDTKNWNAVMTEEIGRMLVVGTSDTDQSNLPESEKCSDFLSEMAENLFLEEKSWSVKKNGKFRPFEVPSHPIPLEVDEENTRRRLMKRRNARTATEHAAARLQQENGSADNEEREEMSSANLHQSDPAKPSPLTTIVETGIGSTESKHDYDRTIIFRRVYISSRDNEEFLEEISDLALSLVHVLFTRQYYMHMSRQSYSQLLSDFLVETTGKHLGSPSYPDFFDPIAEAAVTPRDAQGCMITMREGLVTIVDSETLEDQMLPLVSREAFIKNRNLLYALVADGPLCD